MKKARGCLEFGREKESGEEEEGGGGWRNKMHLLGAASCGKDDSER